MKFIILSTIFLILLTSLLFAYPRQNSLRSESIINIDNINALVKEQLELGYRIPGSNGSLNFQKWIINKISVSTGWNIEVQKFTYADSGIELRNYWITSSNLSDNQFPSYIIGAHYDSRSIANQDDINFPVPGANDGASGVASILEMIRHIPQSISINFGFVLFDAEDQGGIYQTNSIFRNWPWILGSTEFVNKMPAEQIQATTAFILLDMIGDDELSIDIERNSDNNLVDGIWKKAKSLGYSNTFLNNDGPSLIDDHIPFIKAGIAAVDIIDFNYPEWHTTKDDFDHISGESIAIVTDVVYSWIMDQYPTQISTNTLSGYNSSEIISSTSSSSNMQFLVIFIGLISINIIKKLILR